MASLLCDDLGYACDDLGRLAEAGDWQELELAMEILAASEKIRRREPHEREPAAISSATDRDYLAFDAAVLHGLTSEVDDMDDRFDLLAHIIVLVVHVDGDCSVAVLGIELVDEMLKLLLTFLEAVASEVTDNVVQSSLLDSPLHVSEVEEALIVARMLGS